MLFFIVLSSLGSADISRVPLTPPPDPVDDRFSRAVVTGGCRPGRGTDWLDRGKVGVGETCRWLGGSIDDSLGCSCL